MRSKVFKMTPDTSYLNFTPSKSVPKLDSQQLNLFGEKLSYKLHDEINVIQEN